MTNPTKMTYAQLDAANDDLASELNNLQSEYTKLLEQKNDLLEALDNVERFMSGALGYTADDFLVKSARAALARARGHS